MISRKRNPYDKEMEQLTSSGTKDGQLFAKGIIEKAEALDIPIEKDPEILRETGDLDLKNQVPPQIFAVVSGVMNLIKQLEEGER